jgi:putative ABC transport system permease protein
MRSRTAFKLLIHDWTSTAGAVLGVVAMVFLVGQQLSSMFGLFTYMSVLVDHSGADLWVITKNVAYADAIGDIPVRYLERLSGLKEIEWAEPVLIGAGLYRKPGGQFEPVRVVGVSRPGNVLGPWAFFKGSNRDLLDLEAITVDRLDLAKLGYPKIGTTTEINNVRVHVAAITDGIQGFSGTLVFAPFEKVRDIAVTPPGRCSAILVKLKPDADRKAIAGRIAAMLPNAEVISSSALSTRTRMYYIKNTGIGFSFGFSTMVGALVGLVIIILTLYASVLNRLGDFAIMRAIGGRRRDILVVVFCQAFFIGLIGIVVGFLFLAMFLNATRGAGVPSYLPLWVPAVHALMTMVFCLAGSLLAMRRAIQAEPASVFR